MEGPMDRQDRGGLQPAGHPAEGPQRRSTPEGEGGHDGAEVEARRPRADRRGAVPHLRLGRRRKPGRPRSLLMGEVPELRENGRAPRNGRKSTNGWASGCIFCALVTRYAPIPIRPLRVYGATPYAHGPRGSRFRFSSPPEVFYQL